MFDAILQELQAYSRIIIHRHKNPDGDALGSQIGLKHILLENFPGKEVYAVGDAPGRYGFMDDSVMDEIPDSCYSGALAVILDTSAAHLISDERYRLAARTVRIDHHIFCGKLADVEMTDTAYESCCGLITELAIRCGLKLNDLAAKVLYTGMVTDSGRFRYDSTTSGTFRRASRLLEQRFDIGQIYGDLYAEDLSRIRNKAYFILKITTTPRGVAYIYTDRAEQEKLGMDTFSVSRGMVGTMSDIRGVDIWVNFTEAPEGVLCELRSSKYNINPVAVKYGGGGHAKASGACVPDRDTAMAMLRDLEALIGETV